MIHASKLTIQNKHISLDEGNAEFIKINYSTGTKNNTNAATLPKLGQYKTIKVNIR